VILSEPELMSTQYVISS